MIKIIVDDASFIVCKKTVENLEHDSYLYKACQDSYDGSCEYITKCVDEINKNVNIYVDADPYVMKMIISRLRGNNKDKDFNEYNQYLVNETFRRLNLSKNLMIHTSFYQELNFNNLKNTKVSKPVFTFPKDYFGKPSCMDIKNHPTGFAKYLDNQNYKF